MNIFFFYLRFWYLLFLRQLNIANELVANDNIAW